MSEEQTVPKAEGQPPRVQEFKVQGKDLQRRSRRSSGRGLSGGSSSPRGPDADEYPAGCWVASGAVLAVYMPFIAVIAAGAALLGGCTVRVERDEPPAVS